MSNKKILIFVSFLILLGFAGVYFLFPGSVFTLLLKAERSAAGLKQHGIDVKGLHLEYLEGGKGDVLVLLHGFGANKDNWTRMARYLTPRFRVIAPDLTGFGKSSPDPEGDYTISVQARRVNDFVRALGIKSFHLGGHSMGGNIAGIYVSMYPKDLKSLLLISPGGVAACEPSEMYRRLKGGKQNPLIIGSVEDYERLLDFVFVKRPFIPFPIKKVLVQEAMVHQVLNRRIFRQLRSSLDLQALETLMKGLPIKTLIIWGDQDRVLHISGAKILESVMPNAMIAVIDNTGHAPMIEKPQQTGMLYLNFLESK
jgi:pimeloyl-ACP methyl ester carboxylesterase